MKITKMERNDIGQMLDDYQNNLISPMDDMYEEGIIPTCDFFQISNDDNGSGFFAVNDENSILQFYLNDNELENIERIFDEVISRNKIGKALVCSNDPVFYDQCRRKTADMVPHDYMFIEDEKVAKPMPFEGITSERPNIDQLQELLSYFEGIGMAGDWLTYYLTQRINTRSIMLYRFNNEIIGTGEMRPSISSAEYANAGMTVSADFRRRGLGSYILSSQRTQANEQGYKVICSTDSTNTASYKTIINSGFVCYHKVEEMTF